MRFQMKRGVGTGCGKSSSHRFILVGGTSDEFLIVGRALAGTVSCGGLALAMGFGPTSSLWFHGHSAQASYDSFNFLSAALARS